MSKKLKVRLTLLAGAFLGGLLMFLALVGPDAEAPPPKFARLIEPVVYVDNNATPCPVPPPSRACRAARRGR